VFTSDRPRHRPTDVTERFVRSVARQIHRAADAWFGCRRTHRMLVLEALAGIPSSVTAVQHHLRAMRGMRDDRLVRSALVQADHEHAHLLVFSALVQPTPFERAFVHAAQLAGIALFAMLSSISERAAQRLAGYFEEEALESYDDYLRALEAGEVENLSVPRWAVDRWRLVERARLSDLVPAIQEDEAVHRDEHHATADALAHAARRRLDVVGSQKRRIVL
jgi:ubiquinol oxidase